jgi:hypothetical protein
MYLHYIEHIIMQNINTDNVHSKKCKKMYEDYKRELRTANSFVLALDGDMDFKPTSVQLLLDFMKKDPKLGAVCGRIHPTGGGTYFLLDISKYILLF